MAKIIKHGIVTAGCIKDSSKSGMNATGDDKYLQKKNINGGYIYIGNCGYIRIFL